jgi:CrcB protein
VSPGLLVLVGLAGAVGSLLRFAVDGAVTRRFARPLPLGTLAVNASAALLLGALTGLAATTDAALIAGTGLLGGYSTFSTWMLDTHRLAEDRRGRWAVANVVVSLLVGLAAVAAGRAIAG